jgi:outer membrane protein assembly factor BamB
VNRTPTTRWSTTTAAARLRRRLAVPVWLCAAAAGPLAAQERQLPRPQEFVTTQEDSLFSLVRSQEDVHQWEQALADRDRGDHQSAAERLHRLLQTEIGGAAAIGPNRFIGLRHAVVLTLANLPPAGIAAYEELVRREAGGLYDADPVHLREDQLRMLAERFPTAGIGRRAALRLGDLALERGDALAALEQFQQVLVAVPIGSAQEQAVRERLLCADAIKRAVALRGRTDLPPAMKEVLDVLPSAQDRTEWPAYGGGDGSRPMADPVGKPRPYWSQSIQAQGFEDDGQRTGEYAMQAVGGIDGLFVDNGMELHAIDPLRGTELWTSPSPLKEQADLRQLREYLGSINRDMILAPALGDDIVVAALQVPDEASLVRYQNAFTIVHRIPERRLFAFQRSTGKLLWSHFDRLEGPIATRFRGHSSCGPPLIVGDTVYAPVHDRSGAIAFYIGAYDLRTGQPRWRRLVCSSQQEVNMFGNARLEFAASPLCCSEGLLLGASNLGVCYAIERATGRVRWITSYDVIRMPQAQLQGQEARPVRFQNSAPAVTAGVMCCTPLDSDFVLGFDIDDGTPLWRVPYEAKANGNNDVRWLCGAIGNEFVLAGRGVVAVAARPDTSLQGVPALRLIRGEEFMRGDDRDPPRPALSGRCIYFPTSDGISVFDMNGQRQDGGGDLHLQLPGSLLLVDGMIVSLANRMIEVLLDVPALRAEAEARLRRAGDDPAAILRLCTLRSALANDDGDPASLEALYRAGLQACDRQGLAKDHPLRTTFLRRLFMIAHHRGEEASGAEALRLFLAARDVAPDTNAFLLVQSSILQQCRDDRPALLRELALLAERAPDDSYALPGAGGVVPVLAYVDWRRALLAATPRAQLVAWQDLLQRHGDAVIQNQTVATMAEQAIARLIAENGREVYADVEARAAAMLADSGNSTDGLRAVGRTYPHSEAAKVARGRLLDAAVAAGDLGTAVDVFMVAAREGESPTVLRRLLEAARLRGNLGLARAMATRLLACNERSDWQADGGRTCADVARELLPALQPATATVARAVPGEVLAEIPTPSPPFGFRTLPISVEPDFPIAPEQLLYVSFDDQVRAIDLHDPARPTVFTHKVGIVERVWLCAGTLIVANLDRVMGLDARTGNEIWTLQASGRMLVSYGVVGGVLQITDNDDETVLLGIEPLTGHVLYRRPLPKPTDRDILVLRAAEDQDPVVERRDPITGRTTGSFTLGRTMRDAAQVPPTMQLGLLLQRFAATDKLLFVEIDSALSNGPSRVFAVAADGSIAWSWTGARQRHVTMTAVRGDRLCIAEAGTPGGGRVVVLDAATGSVVREVATGNDARVLNWQRQRTASPAPASLLLSDIDEDSGDRRLLCVPVDDGGPTFAKVIGTAGEEVLRAPWIDPEHVVFGVDSPRTQGPVRVFALDTQNRSSALPAGRPSLLVPVPQRSGHELVAAGPYTVLVTDARLYVLGDGKDAR